MDLQSRIVRMHEDLSVNHDLWFYAGVGKGTESPQLLWEAYEQSRQRPGIPPSIISSCPTR